MITTTIVLHSSGFVNEICTNIVLVLARQSRMFYKTQETTLCDICEGDDCGEMCKVRAEKQSSASASADNMNSSSSISTGAVSFVLASITVLVVRFMCF